MKLLKFVIPLLVASYAYSDQGLVLRFLIEKTDDTNISHSYENAVLISFQEEHIFQFPYQYELVVFAQELSQDTVNVQFEYSDMQTGIPEHIDSYEDTLLLSKSASTTQLVKSGDNSYQLTLWASYGELP